MSNTEIKKFDADVGKVLDLMIHSLYTNKDIFLRELISNASDACDKLRYLAQTNNALLNNDTELKITVQIDKDARKLIISDNGIGMNRQDLIDNLGTIASSGTQKFLESIQDSKKIDGNLIGQFGVGFYSSYMVADNVELVTRKAGEKDTYLWSSSGNGEYSISQADTDFDRGTRITLHIKEGSDEFLDQYRVKNIIKNYSDHIAVAVYYIGEDKKEVKLNSSSALWTRNKADITQEQYEEFYKSVSHSIDKPWLVIHNKNEGIIEFSNLLFIPSERTFDLFHPDRLSRVKLYIKKVFITDDNVELLPKYLRFVRGVIDSEDLPLNISRETLQHNATIEKIKKAITKRIIDELKTKLKDDREEYNKFWENFGSAIKEGMCEAGPDSSSVMDLCLFNNTNSDKKITLDEYIAGMKPGQKTIYYLSGEDPNSLKKSPQIEGLLSKGINVLLFTDHVDDFWVSVNNKYKDYDIISATRTNIGDDGEDDKSKDDKTKKEKKSADNNLHKDLISYFKEILGDAIKDVKISKKLTSSPICLAVDNSAMDIRMERFLVEQKQLNKASAKIVEINPNNKIIQKIESSLSDTKTKEGNKDLVKLLFDQACIVEGEPVQDIHGFNLRMIRFLQNVSESEKV